MKFKAMLFALALSAASVFAQGNVNFQNSGISTRINDPSGTAIVAGGQVYSFQLFYGSSAGSLNNSTTVFFNSDTQTGRIAGGDINLANAPANVPAFFQLRAWQTSYGSFTAARDGGGQFYESAVITATPSGAPNPATPLFGTTPGTSFQGFNFQVVPEPSTFALGALGIGALLMVRRRKA